MEGFFDEMYGDLGLRRCESPVAHDEDSVDIYSGLDSSPNNTDNAVSGNLVPVLSPQKLKDSMDLYEEIITQEQQEREATYNELKTKLDAAEKQVKELVWKLQQMQTQNTSLHTENTCLKKNICALIKTARMEIVRKDQEISRISQRSGRNGCAPSFPRSLMNQQRNHSVRTCGPAPVVRTQEPRVGSAPEKDRNGVVPRSVTASVDVPSSAPSCHGNSRGINADPEATNKCVNPALVNSSRNPRSIQPSSKGPVLPYKQCAGSDNKRQTGAVTQTAASQASESRGHQNSDQSNSNKEQKAKEREEFDHRDGMNSCRGRRQHAIPDLPRRSDRRSSLIQTSHSSTAAASTHPSRARHRDQGAAKKTGGSPERRHSRSRCSGSSSESSGKDRRQPGPWQDSVPESHRRQRSPRREHRRKEERRCVEENVSSARKEKCQELEGRKGVESGAHRKESEVLTSSRKERDISPPRRQSDGSEISKMVKGPIKSLKSNSPVEPANCNKEHEPVAVECDSGERNIPDESGKNRKLSFMETLNLTLSPVKKPRLSFEDQVKEGGATEGFLESQTGDCSEFDLGEDYRVIDELGSSHDETEEVLVAAPSISSGPKIDRDTSPKCVDLEPSLDRSKSHIQASTDELEAEREMPDQKKVLESVDVSVFPNNQDAESTTSENPGSVLEMKEIHGSEKSSPDSPAEIHTGDSTDQMVVVTDNQVIGGTRDSLACETVCVKSFVTVTQDSIKVCVEDSTFDRNGHIQSVCLPGALSSVSVSTEETCDISTETVSSTVNIEMSQSCVEITETVALSSTDSGQKCSQVDSQPEGNAAEVPKVSSSLVKEPDGLAPAPAPTGCCHSEPDSTEDEERSSVPSSSAPLLLDEDSLMLTLKSIRLIRTAISPLTSPVRPARKSQPLSSGKATHVKSLNKEFSSVTAFSANARQMDVNKENEKPDCSSTRTPPRVSDHAPAPPTPSSSSSSEDEDELEEGEIVSDSDEEALPVPASQQEKKAGFVTTSRSQPSPRSPRLAKKQAQMTPAVSQGNAGVKNKPTSTTKKPLSKKRHFKTILPILPKTNPNSIQEVLDMLKLVGTLMRKKYMKLHKSFPKKSFYNIVDMSLFSFTDFVNVVNFSQLCSVESDLKPKLRNIISVAMTKISNNGIVKRIFEQQAPSLKKKLWTFVEAQFDFLFKEVQAVLSSLCKASHGRLLSKAEKKPERPSVGSSLCKASHGRLLSKAEKKPERPSVGSEKEVRDILNKSTVHSPPKARMGKVERTETSKSSTIMPYGTGLGSRGKNLKMGFEEEKEEESQVSEAEKPVFSLVCSSSAGTPTKNATAAEKPAACVRRLSHSGSLQDKSDFEILTEQQASSLTFNLVTDSQMGEIFKCLLQGSDLLENSVSVGEHHSWPVCTPRKDTPSGDNSVSVTTPKKATVTTPSKLVTAWSAISPRRFSSPNHKIVIPQIPAVLDESCMLETPSSPSLPVSRVNPSPSAQRSFSILSEDLAVSLTLPSPLKSDGHLSFLHQMSGESTSAPDSVISAHFSEDALLDGEDATEQDIHLALDSDNSSGGSSVGRTWEETAALQAFQFKPHLPMQAVVMEKSNDHFIVRIRHTSVNIRTPPSSPGRTPPGAEMGEGQQGAENPASEIAPGNSLASPRRDLPERAESYRDANATRSPREDVTESLSPGEEGPGAVLEEPAVLAEDGDPAEQGGRHGGLKKKRKKRHAGPRAKRIRTDVTRERTPTRRKKKSSKRTREKGRRSRSKAKSPPLSPDSLSAKNVIRKKGEVVVTWTRQEDRDILIEWKTKGSSPEMFLDLSTKINKSPSQIENRLSQLMRLFMKKEKMKG